jgi:hypothetical protein
LTPCPTPSVSPRVCATERGRVNCPTNFSLSFYVEQISYGKSATN